jgi:hypothetical protein
MPYRVLINVKLRSSPIRSGRRTGRGLSKPYSASATNRDHGEARGYKDVPDIVSESVTAGRSRS